MKSYVAVQKKLLVLIYVMWKKKEAYQQTRNSNYSGEQEQMSSSLLSFEEAGYFEWKQIAPTKGGATQGKHSVEPVAACLLSANAKINEKKFGRYDSTFNVIMQ